MHRLRAAFAAHIGGLPTAFWWLWTGAAVSALATFVFPFLALYLTSRGFDAQRTGLVVALYGVGAMGGGPLAGTLADRVGRRPTVLAALAGCAVSAAYLGFVRSPLLLALGVLAFGLSNGMAHPTFSATIADVLPPAARAHAFGLLYWANNLGVGFSALVGGAIASKSWLGLFFADAATTAIFAMLVWRRVPETRPPPILRRAKGAASPPSCAMAPCWLSSSSTSPSCSSSGSGRWRCRSRWRARGSRPASTAA